MILLTLHKTLCLSRFEKRHAPRVTIIRTHNAHTIVYYFYAPAIRRMVEGHKVLPLSVRASLRPCVRPLSKFVVRSITFEILH